MAQVRIIQAEIHRNRRKIAKFTILERVNTPFRINDGSSRWKIQDVDDLKATNNKFDLVDTHRTYAFCMIHSFQAHVEHWTLIMYRTVK